MSISRDEVKHIALLSRLELSEEEVDLYTRDIAEILDYVEKLKEVDITGVEPTSHAVPMYNVMRRDEVQKHLSTEEALMNAPETEPPFFKVPRVTE
ncbi:MAG: Asp-tRNA(Asn)/Glu-tRNA(Gln) amidotransferase subunit GatC [bacterium]|jgi:aspartyl-tRNA(Asn)/glutamyl-tRNA(Gln) amidotransferase subunit C